MPSYSSLNIRDLHKNAQQAVRYIIDQLVTERGLTAQEAYCLCGAAIDLKISEIVDAYLPLAIFA